MNFSDRSGLLAQPLKLLGICGAIVGLAIATIYTVRIGLADFYFHRHTLIATEKAVRLTPGRASYRAHLAGYLRDTDPTQATEALQRAVALDPYDAAAWVRLGLSYEADDHLTEASQCLHRASDVDRTFLPAWSLANFYFRRGDADRFWYWIRQASRLVPQDASPLFRLCWHFTDNGTVIARQLDLGRPGHAGPVSGFPDLAKPRGEVGPVALHLAASNRSQDTASLLNACDWLLARHRPMAALDLWNLLANQHRIPFHAIHAASKPTVTNADFLHSPSSTGFDWRLPTVTGVNASREYRTGGLRLEFSGDEPESAEVLTQVLAVRPNTAYKFMFDYSTSDIAPGMGLTWRVVNLDPASVLAASDSLSADKGAVGHVDFTTSADSRFLRVSLVYQRALGTTRIQGSLVLQKTGLATAHSSKT